MNTTRQSKTWHYDLVKGIILLILLGLMLYFRPDMSAQIQRQLGLPFGTVTVLDAPPVTGGNPTTLSGHSQAGAIVEVFAGEASLGTATAGADGSWSLPVTLPAGTYQLRAQARDAAGAAVGSPAVLDWSSEQQAAAAGTTAEEPAAPAQEAAVSEADTSTGTGADVSTGTDTDTDAVAEVDTAAPVQSEGGTATGAAVAGAQSASAASSASAQGSLGAAQVADGTANLSGSGTPGTTVEVVAIAAAGGAGTAGAVTNSAGNKTDAIENTGSGEAEAGSAEAGSAEKSAAAEAVLGSVVVAADGTWQLTAKINPGEYAVTVRTLDADGATVDESAGVPLSVPGTAITGSAAAGEAGQSTRPGVTASAEVTAAEPATASVSAPITTSVPSARAPQVSAPVVAGDKVTLTGMAAPGAAVELVTSDEVLGEAAADADGLWIVAVQLDPGSYALRIRTVDDTDKSVQYSRMVSLTVPAARSPTVTAGETITAAAGVAAAVAPTATKNTTTTAAAPATGAATVSGTVSVTGTAALATSAVKGTSAVTATRTATASATVTTTAAVAAAATVSGTVSATGTAALATPAVKGTSAVTATTHTTAAGTATTTSASVTTAVTDTTPTTATAATTASPAATKTPAAHAASSATLTATAAAGAAGAVTPTAPAAATAAATSVLPTLGQPEISGSTLTLSGTGTPGTSIEIVSGATVLGKATVGADGTWSLASEVKPGSYKLQVVRKDAAGKVISQSPVVSLDIPSAVAEPVLDTPEVAADNMITLTGTGEPGSEVDIVQDGAVIATAPVQNDGQWTYAYPAAKTGNVQVAAQVSGEPATRTRPVIVVVPVVVAPAAPAPTPTAEPTAEPTPAPTAEPEPTADAAESSGGQAYVVQPGDTLTALAQEYLGSETRYKEIVAATNEMAKQDPAYKQITDPNMIVVGQQIWIPAR